MTQEKAHNLLMDFLYDEISTEDKEDLKKYLNSHPEMLDELKELRKTQKLLGKMPEVESPQKLHMIEPRKRTFGVWLSDAKSALPQSGWGKASLAVAACLLFLLIAGSVASLQFNSDETGFSLSLGYGNQADRSVIEQPEKQNFIVEQEKDVVSATQNKNVITAKEADKFLTTDEAEMLLAKMQKQNRAMIAAFAKQMNKQDQLQLQKIVKFFQAQRIYDLKRIQQGLNRTQLASAYRWKQTNRVLGEVIEAASVEK